MLQLNTLESLRQQRQVWREQALNVAFVPTMGNLHSGHLALVKTAKKHADIVIVSIFVNPMQFGENEDLDAYPRTLANDKQKLEEVGADAVFTPSVADIYPRGLAQQTFVEVPGISNIICGVTRPIHFRGVATIVCKLFNMVAPDAAFFGEKDFQQLQVIKTMVADLSLPIEVHGVPTQREDDGLAMSSRNGYLSPAQRQQAPMIYSLLQTLAERLKQGEKDFAAMEHEGNNSLVAAGFKQDYVTIRNAMTLDKATADDHQLVILIAAYLGNTRLIDNLQVNL
jgi:pantoate--beta-alanine ligase